MSTPKYCCVLQVLPPDPSILFEDEKFTVGLQIRGSWWHLAHRATQPK